MGIKVCYEFAFDVTVRKIGKILKKVSKDIYSSTKFCFYKSFEIEKNKDIIVKLDVKEIKSDLDQGRFWMYRDKKMLINKWESMNDGIQKFLEHLISEGDDEKIKMGGRTVYKNGKRIIYGDEMKLK